MNRQEQFEMLKQEYKQVTVSEQALTAVQQGIQRARQEEQKEQKEREKQRPLHHLRYGKVAAVAALAVVAVLNLSPQAAVAVASAPALQKVVQIITLNRYDFEAETSHYAAHIETPELSASGDAKLQSSVGEINTEVQAYADQMIAQFEQDMKQQGGVYGLDILYNVVTDTDNWFTLQVTTVETMASGAETRRYYNLNKKTGAYVKLADLFPEKADYVTVLSDVIKQQMKQRMAEDEAQIYFIDSDMPEFDFTQIAADQSFYCNGDGQLVIVFQEYEVAPGSMGCPEFVIDEAVVNALLQQ